MRLPSPSALAPAPLQYDDARMPVTGVNGYVLQPIMRPPAFVSGTPSGYAHMSAALLTRWMVGHTKTTYNRAVLNVRSGWEALTGPTRAITSGSTHLAIWRTDDGPRTLCRSRAPERLLAVADGQNEGVTYGQEWMQALGVAQVHATLALAAATAVDTAGSDRHAWADLGATKLSARKPEATSDELGFLACIGSHRLWR
jgi:hypothetical protein